MSKLFENPEDISLLTSKREKSTRPEDCYPNEGCDPNGGCNPDNCNPGMGGCEPDGECDPAYDRTESDTTPTP